MDYRASLSRKAIQARVDSKEVEAIVNITFENLLRTFQCDSSTATEEYIIVLFFLSREAQPLAGVATYDGMPVNMSPEVSHYFRYFVKELIEKAKTAKQEKNRYELVLISFMHWDTNYWMEDLKFLEIAFKVTKVVSVASITSIEDLFKQGREKAEKGDYSGAIENYTHAIRLNSNFADAYHYRGIAQEKLGLRERASQDYAEATRLNPTILITRITGERYSPTNTPDNPQIADLAKASITQANTGVNINSAEHYLSQGILYYESGDEKRAIQSFTQAIEINPQYVDAYVGRAIVNNNNENYKRALEDCNQALKLNSQRDAAYMHKGSALYKMGDNQGAIAAHNQAIKLNPQNSEAYYNRALVRIELEDVYGAIIDFTQSIKFNPYDEDTYYNRGVCHQQVGNEQGAVADYTQCLKLSPQYIEAYNNRADAFVKLGNYRGALEDCNQALKINPQYARAYINRGNARYKLGDKQGANMDHKKAAQLKLMGKTHNSPVD